MVDLGSASSGIKKLNSHNYGYWKTCMESYLQGQDLWEVIEGAKAVPPEKESALRKWRIKAVKSICREISQLEPEEKVSDARMKRIIIHGLRPDYNGFIATVRGWPTQPSLVELENLLTNQEELAKQMGRITLKEEEEALFTNNKKKGPPREQGRPKPRWIEGGKPHPKERRNTSGGAQGKREDRQNMRKYNDGCFNCGKKRKRRRHPVSEEEWDTEAGFSLEVDEEELEEDMEAPSFAATTTPALNYKEDWIVDSGCSNHMTNDYKKLEDMADYKGRRVVLTADNTKLPISHVGKATISRYGPQQLQLEKVYHVPELKKNLLSVPQLIAEGKYVLFGPNKVAIFGQVKGGSIRQELYYMLKDEKDIYFAFGSVQDHGASKASQGMHSSKFCLNIAGDTPSSNCLFDAIVSHCIPVIISDDIELPYEDVLDYSKFSIFVRSSDAVKKGYLMGTD
ncbi:hypothetical protein PR202_ga24915 [Eleusine coracana subsp. coracana]|uniref:DUF4219 domain-containing protein n=1 Tax=Eleusine coracana subsp. coracana TaxID=191504 RepID=A0AAV5DA04_ELECO|nr:hypothetical protein PR202_ga24915 [Eleusine coracana subsp. coracana]